MAEWSILNKKIGMASVYFADQNKIELWTDTGDGKWVKQCEGIDVKGFNPKASTFECQLRIDGFERAASHDAYGSSPANSFKKLEPEPEPSPTQPPQGRDYGHQKHGATIKSARY